MRIGGLIRCSLIDYPGFLSAVVFTQGCNFNCPYCYNPELMHLGRWSGCAYSEESILDFLSRRAGKLDAVVISGGEPTIQTDLPGFVTKVSRMGFKVKLDTNGSYPHRLLPILGEGGVDFVAMDIKNKASLYPETAGCAADVNGIVESIRGIMASGISHLFRTTMVKPFVAPDDILEIAKMLSQLGARHYHLQPYLKSEKGFMKDVLPENQYRPEEIDALQLEVDKVLTNKCILAA